MRAARGPVVRPPGPTGFRWSGNLPAFEQDRLGFLLDARDRFGGVVTFDTGTTIVNDPVLALEVLGSRSHHFDIAVDLLNRPISVVDGARSKPSNPNPARVPPIRTPDPAAWRKTIGDRVGTALLAEAEQTQTAAQRPTILLDPINTFEPFFGRLTAEYYFGPDWEPMPAAVAALLEALSRVFGNVLALPSSWPTAANRRVRRHYRVLRRLVEDLIRDRTSKTDRKRQPQADFLDRLLERSPPHDDQSLGRLSQAIIGSLLAAYRVPVAGLAWTLLELAGRPELQARVQSESTHYALRATAETRTAADCVREAIRLHPPTWLLRRTSSAAVRLADFWFPAGSHFLVSPWVIHRDDATYDHASSFDPDRWLSRSASQAPMLAFGYGRHYCPGARFACATIEAVVEELCRRWHISLRDDSDATPLARTTLLPRAPRLSLTLASTPRTRAT